MNEVSRRAAALEVKWHIKQNGCRLFFKGCVSEKGKPCLCPSAGGSGGCFKWTDSAQSLRAVPQRALLEGAASGASREREREHGMSSLRPRFEFKTLMRFGSSVPLCYIYLCERWRHPAQASACQLTCRC